MAVVILEPATAESTTATFLSLFETIVGLIDENGRLPGRMKFATDGTHVKKVWTIY